MCLKKNLLDMIKILVVEDEQRMRELVALYLQREGWQVIVASNGKEGLASFHSYAPDLIVLDVMLPEIDGWAVCRRIRKNNSTVPIVMLTARLTQEDELFGFELGANDYISKPFNPNILVARIKSALKKSTVSPVSYCYDDLEIDVDMHRVLYRKEEIELSPKEFRLLVCLASKPGLALERNRILNAVWGLGSVVADRVVDTTVKRLRKKIPGDHIKTLRGFGYRFESKK